MQVGQRRLSLPQIRNEKQGARIQSRNKTLVQKYRYEFWP